MLVTLLIRLVNACMPRVAAPAFARAESGRRCAPARGMLISAHNRREPLDANGWCDANARSARTQAGAMRNSSNPSSRRRAPRFLVLADLKPVIRSNAQRTEARLAWFSNGDLDDVRPCRPPTRCSSAWTRPVERAFCPGRHRAPHPPCPRRHREAAPDRRPALACHAGHHVAGGAVALRAGARAGAMARERPLLRPLRRHHAGQGRRLAAQVLGLRPGMVPAHRPRRDHADHRRRALPAGARAPLWRQDVSRRSPASSSLARTSPTPCAARCWRRPTSGSARSTYHSSQPWPFPHSLMLGCIGPGRDHRDHHRQRRDSPTRAGSRATTRG